MAVVSRVAQIHLATAAGSRYFNATAATQDTAAGSSVVVTIAQSSDGAAPPGVPDTFTLRYKSADGTVIRSVTLTPGAASQTDTYFFTSTGLTGGAHRAGTIIIDLQVTKTTGGPTATYDHESDGSPATGPSALSGTLKDRGFIRGTTTGTLKVSKDGGAGAATATLAYPDAITARLTLAAQSYQARTVTLALGPVSAVSGSTTNNFDAALGTADNRFPAAATSYTPTVTIPNDALTGVPWTSLGDRVLDESGNNRHAYPLGAPLPALVASPWGAAFGNALEFDGVDREGVSQAIQTAPISSAGLTAFTLEGKVRRDRTGVTELPLHWGDSGAVHLAQVFVDAFDNRLKADVALGGGPVRYDAGPLPVGTHDIAVVWTGSAIMMYVDGTRTVNAAHASFVNASQPLTLGRQWPVAVVGDASPYPLDGAIDAVRLSNVARYTGASYTPASAPFTPDANTMVLLKNDAIVRDLTPTAATVDPVKLLTPLFQKDDNTFGTPPLSKDDTAHLRLNSQQGFLGGRITNARGEGVNGLTISRTLTPRKPGDVVQQTGLVTITQGGEAGWSPSLLPWQSPLPSGIWDKAVTVTAPANATGAAYTVPAPGTSTEYTLVAQENYVVRVNVNHDAANAQRHFEAGMAFTVVAQLVDLVSGQRVASTDIDWARCTVTRANPQDVGGLSNTFQFLESDTLNDGTEWEDWLGDGVQHRFDLSVSPADSRVYERRFTNTASWGGRDFRVAVQLQSGGFVYSGDLVVPNLGQYNNHGAAFTILTSGGPTVKDTHFRAGLAFQAGLAAVNAANGTTAAAVNPAVAILRLQDAGANAGRGEYLAEDNTWVPIVSSVTEAFFHPVTLTRPSANLYTKTWTAEQTAAWGAYDLFVIGRATVDGIQYSDFAKEVGVGLYHGHDLPTVRMLP